MRKKDKGSGRKQERRIRENNTIGGAENQAKEVVVRQKRGDKVPWGVREIWVQVGNMG